MSLPPEERPSAAAPDAASSAAAEPSSLGSASSRIVELLITGAPLRTFYVILLVAIYFALAALTAWHHEPWFDEAQAWLIARDASLVEMATSVLRYEGHPPLWYLILAIPAKLGLPFRFLPLLSVLIATAGIAVLLLIPGVPRAVRVLAPFSYILLYQYSVVARSYVLIPLLLFLIAASWPRRFERPVRFAVLLALLMHVSLHGAIFAFMIFLSWGYSWQRQERMKEWRRVVAPLLILTLAAAIFLAVLLPIPSDISIKKKLEREWPQRLEMAAQWGIQSALVPGLVPSLLLTAAILPWLWERRILGLVIAQLIGLTLVMGVYLNVWHLGLYTCMFLFAFAVAAQTKPEPGSPRERTLRALATAAFAIALVIQVGDAMAAVRVDIERPYSGSQAAAEAIAQLPLDQVTLDGLGFSAIAVQAYFDEPIFDNYGNPQWWRWTASSPWNIEGRGGIRIMALVRWLRRTLAARPDYLLLPLKFPTDRIPLQIMAANPDYELVAGFPGAITWRGNFLEHDSLILFVRTDSDAPRPSIQFDDPPRAAASR